MKIAAISILGARYINPIGLTRCLAVSWCQVEWMQQGSPIVAAEVKTMPASWMIHGAFIFLGVASFLMSNGKWCWMSHLSSIITHHLSWVSVYTIIHIHTALWAEMSVLYRSLPEGNRLGSYLLICLQCGNIVPAILMIEGAHLRLMELRQSIWLILILGFTISQLASFLWS